MFRSKKYNKEYDVNEVTKMYGMYLDYCIVKGITPDYLKDEFLFLIKEKKIPESFLNNLVYHKNMIEFLKSNK